MTEGTARVLSPPRLPAALAGRCNETPMLMPNPTYAADPARTPPQPRPVAGEARLMFFGGGFDTANLGVSALTESCIRGLDDRLENPEFLIFDHTPGLTSRRLPAVDGAAQGPAYDRSGGMWTRRVWRNDALLNLDYSARLGGLLSPQARRFRNATALLDISGGDSFTDIYGQWIYEWVMLPKQIALRQKVPLVLLPQTYGPFKDPKNKATAAEVCRGASVAWARDAISFERLKDLLGDDFDPQRHRQGTDVAFGLPPRRPDRLPDALAGLLAERGTPIVGLNVSGLILNDLERRQKSFGFRANYGELVRGLLRRLLDDSDARVLLVPHVIRPIGHYESDPQACHTLFNELSPDDQERVSILPSSFDQGEIKWVIGQCDWFCGTRMHSTIAALSSGVPTAAIAYSIKTQGIFDACASGDAVSDPMTLDTGDAGEVLWSAWQNRADLRERLAAALVDVKAKAAAQMDAIAAACVGGRAG